MQLSGCIINGRAANTQNAKSIFSTYSKYKFLYLNVRKRAHYKTKSYLCKRYKIKYFVLLFVLSNFSNIANKSGCKRYHINANAYFFNRFYLVRLCAYFAAFVPACVLKTQHTSKNSARASGEISPLLLSLMLQ